MQDTIHRLREKQADEGFTLIELLVVVVIIGVLVAIAIPVYLNYRQGAADKSAQSDVRGAISAVEQFYTTNNNTYPNAASATGTAIPLVLTAPATFTAGTINLSDNTQLSYVHTAGATSYLVCGNNTGGSGKWYKYDSSVGGSVKSVAAALTLATCL